MKFLSYTKPAMKNTRQTNINIHRDAWVEINISNLENNIREIKKNVPQGIKLLGVVKLMPMGMVQLCLLRQCLQKVLIC